MSIIPWLIGAIPGVIGAISGSSAQNQANVNQGESIGLQKRALDYQMQRQALVDPLFKELLQRTLLRTRNAPSFGGLRAPAFGALRRPLNQLPALPPPQLIGTEPVAQPGAGGATPGGGSSVFNDFLSRQER